MQPHISCFLMPHVLIFHFTALILLSCKLTLRKADKGIQETVMHSSSGMDDDNCYSSRANLNDMRIQTQLRDLKGRVLSTLKTTSSQSASGSFLSAVN